MHDHALAGTMTVDVDKFVVADTLKPEASGANRRATSRTDGVRCGEADLDRRRQRGRLLFKKADQ